MAKKTFKQERIEEIERQIADLRAESDRNYENGDIEMAECQDSRAAGMREAMKIMAGDRDFAYDIARGNRANR
jgi:hypothetical protein